MASIYSWESFIRIHGGEPGARDVFEKLMDELLRAENPGKEVHIVKAVQGDGGIDVYVHQEDGIDIYQCKFFMESMNSSRWNQVFKSFSKAMESKGVKVLRWVLCMPREMQKDDITKWNAFKEDRKSYGVEIQFVDGNEIIQRMEKCDRNKGTNLIERYFGGTREPLSSNNIIESIRKASITQRAEIFKGRNKFNGLEIFEDLIPLAVSEKGFDEPVGIDADGIETPLYDYFNKYENDDLMLIGEGGIGKTTFLAHLMKTITPETDPAIVPIYIELNCCPQEIGNWFVDADKKSNFITRYIASLINHRDLGQYTVSELDGIEYALSHRSDAVYLLLLDGFNEVTVNRAEGRRASDPVREFLKQEITVLSECPNVRIIMTTRAMSDGYLPLGFRKIRLKGLEDDKIVKYLRACDFSETDAKWIQTNRQLMKCLRIPLFLCMFACRNKYEKIHPTTKGEILYHFFHRGTPFYSEKKKIRDDFADRKSERECLAFIEDFLLPAIAYEMYVRGAFHMSKKTMIKCVKDSLRDPLMEFAAETSGFIDYETETSSLDAVYNAVKKEKTEDILYRCVNVLSIINSSNGQGVVSYAFIHHHIRDYFAAYYIVQRIRCALYHYAERIDEETDIRLDRDQELFMNVRGSLEPIYYERLDDSLKRFIGEILGEHRNVLELVDGNGWKQTVKVFNEQDTLKAVLDMFRYQEADPRNTIYNIVEIFKTVRTSLSGESFDGLDLKNCCFYEAICASGTDDNKVGASFHNCDISDQTFWFRGHLERFRDIKASMNNSLLFTYGEDDQVCIWELPSMYQKMHYTTDVASYHEAHSPYQTEIVVSAANEFMIPAYEVDLISGEMTTLSSKIVHYSITDGIVNLTEEGENREVMCMSYSCDGKVLGVWGTDTLRIFDTETGELCKTIRYQVPGETLGVIYTTKGQIVLQVRIEEESMTRSTILHSKWGLYLLEDVGKTTASGSALAEGLDSGTVPKCVDGGVTLLMEYESAKNIEHPKNTPAFDVDAGGRYFVYYADQGIYLFDLMTLTSNEIWSFVDGSVPVWIQFVDTEASSVAVQWADKMLYLTIPEGKPALYENGALSNTVLCTFTKNSVLFVDQEGGLFQWNLSTDKISDELIPRVKLEIEDLKEDRSGNLIVRYSNNCILTIDVDRGMLVDTFYSNENDAFIEAGLFLDNINRQLILLRTPEYEQLLLYDNHTGMIERVDIYSYERLKFVNARAAGNTLFVGFDKKVIAVDLLTMKQVKVWNQRAGEVLFDMEIEVEDGAGGEFSGGENSVERISVLLLLQWRMLCKRPKYTVLRGSVEEGFTASGERNVEYIEASLVKDLVFCNNDDIDYYGMDAISNQAIFTTRALGEQNGRTVLKRVFMFVKKPTSFLNSITSVSNSIYVMQFDENRVVTVRDYQEVGIFNKKTGNKTLIRVSDPNDPDNLIQILDCHLCLNDKLYCRTVDDKLIQVNAETGFLERTFDFMPGIIVSGCDFTGSKLSENMKQILIQHGGVFEG